MALYQTEGIVLRTHSLNDGDKIAVVFTKNHGVVRGYAKGARKIKSKFGSSFEPLTVANFNYTHKENQETVRFENTDISRSHFDFAVSQDIFELVSYWCELLLEFLPPNLPDERIYRMITACLSAIEHGANPVIITCYFETWLLKLTGFLPDLFHCKSCDNSVTVVNFSVFGNKGVFCNQCSINKTDELQKSAHNVLRQIMQHSPKEFSTEKTMDTHSVIKLTDIIRSIIREVIER